MLLGDDRSAFGLDAAYRDLWLLFRIYEVPVSYSVYQCLQVAAGAAIALLCWMRQRQGWPRAALLNGTLALTTAWMLLLGPAPESATFVLLAPSLAWATVANLAAPRSWPRLGLLFGATVVFGLAYMFGWFPGAAALYGKGFHPLAMLFWVTYLLLERPPHSDAVAAGDVTLPARAA